MFPSKSTLFAILSISAVLVEASHDIRSPHVSHKKRASTLVRRNAEGKRCKVKAQPVLIPSSSSASVKHAPTSTKKDAPAPASSTKAAAAPTPTPDPAPAPSSGGGGNVITVQSPQCGASGASPDSSATNGPNGKLSWLNCGVAAGGWAPPPVKATDLVTKSLSDAINQAPFNACADYVQYFNKYAGANNLPPILLASIAMQESSCNKNTVGGAGEQGLMQLTKDKCGDAPGGDCKDPDYNIRTGAKYFADTLAGNNGNILETMGQYNGWFVGMTVGKATAAASSSCCRCQQNLDYLQQLFNGWLQGIDPYATKMGQYFNLNRCS